MFVTWAHAFFRLFPSLCILKAELQAPWPVLPSPLAILQLKERSHEGSSHGELYCGGSRLQIWNQQEVIAYLHTLMFNYSQPPTGCVGWALSSLMVTWWWIRGAESSVLKVKWASRDIASFLLFQSSKPYSTLELLRKEKRWPFLYLASWSFPHYLALEMQVVGGLEVELTFLDRW